jgi:hypothetical protein
MNDDNFGPWIDWAGGPCPIPDAKAGDWVGQFRFGAEFIGCGCADEYNWADRDFDSDIIAYRVRLPADDLLRQAIEALTNSCDLLENYIDTFGDMSGANRADLNDYRAVLTAYDKREQS